MLSIIQQDLRAISDTSLPLKKLAGATILVTGANGFLASTIIKSLIYLNETIGLKIKIYGLMRKKKREVNRLIEEERCGKLIILRQDVETPIKELFSPEIIIHAASPATPAVYQQDPVGTISPNVLGTYSLLSFAKKVKIKQFVFISSSEVYGNLGDSPHSVSEKDMGYLDPFLVRSCYAESKRIAESLCLSFDKQFSVPTRILRPFHTYGPNMNLLDGRVFCDFVSDIVHGRNILIKGDGKAIRSYCYISDFITGLFTVILEGTDTEVYNIGNEDCNISVEDLAHKLTSIFPEKKLNVIKEPRASGDQYISSTVSRITPDTSKLRSIGWKPQVGLSLGFKRTILSYL